MQKFGIVVQNYTVVRLTKENLMAKLIPFSEKDIFQNKVEDYLKKSTEDYIKFFDGRATFVTYYSKNNISSFHEATLDAAIEMIGTASPLRYNKIEDFVFYQFPNLDLNLVDDEMGLSTEIQGEAVIPPNTGMEPLVDDYFILDGLPDRYLFRILKVNFDKISGKNFYKVEFALEFYEEESIEKQVKETFINNYDSNLPMISKQSATLIDTLNNYSNSIIDFLIENFYYEPLNYFYFTFEGKKVYDALWSNHVKKNALTLRPTLKELLNSVFLSEINLGKVFTKNFIKGNYSGSIFEFFDERTKISSFSKFNFSLIGNPLKSNELSFEGETVYVSFPSVEGQPLFDSDFQSKIVSGEVYTDSTHSLENFIILNHNNKINKDNIVAKLEDLDVEETVKSFFLLPYILNAILVTKKILT
jgi:hypothetical protein